MERKYKITIPEPCHEDWDKMIPNKNGRFCRSCSKNVVDFTTMLPAEIQVYFQKHNNVCGRFKNSQLDSLTIQIPNQVLYSQKHYHKIFLLALFIAMGTTLFSCSDKNGNKQKIDKVEVVEDRSEMKNITVGVRLPPKKDPNDTLHNIPPPPPPKLRQIKFLKPEKIECGEITEAKDNSSNYTKDDNSTIMGMIAPEMQPNFPGGITQFLTFFGNEFNRPESITSANSKIRISFAVEKDGSLTYIESIKPIDKILETEIIRVLKLSPKWEPGESNGKKTRMTYSLPIVFQ